MNEVVVTVRGQSETRVLPERGTARVTVSVDGPDRADVVARVAELASPLRDDLAARQAAGTIESWSSQRTSIWAERPWNAEGKVLDLVHHGSVELAATFTDFTALSDWLNDLAGRDGLHVGSVSWELSPETRARVEREVAVNAVTVAVERATAYASAIGRSTVTPLEIADLGLLTPGRQDVAPRMYAKAAAELMDAAGPAGAVGFQPDEIVVSAAVEARFRAS